MPQPSGNGATEEAASQFGVGGKDFIGAATPNGLRGSVEREPPSSTLRQVYCLTLNGGVDRGLPYRNWREVDVRGKHGVAPV